MNRLLAVTALFLVPVRSADVSACPALCSCKPERDISEAKDRATVVLEAVALDSTLGGSVVGAERDRRFVVRLAVGRVWKGEIGDTLSVVTRAPGAGCGFYFLQGERYLLFAYRTDGDSLEATMCSPSLPWAKARDIIQQLGQPLRSGAA